MEGRVPVRWKALHLPRGGVELPHDVYLRKKVVLKLRELLRAGSAPGGRAGAPRGAPAVPKTRVEEGRRRHTSGSDELSP